MQADSLVWGFVRVSCRDLRAAMIPARNLTEAKFTRDRLQMDSNGSGPKIGSDSSSVYTGPF